MLSDNIEIFLDRTEVKMLPQQIQQFLVGNNLVSSTSKEFVSFCGLLSFNRKKYIFFPRNSSLSVICSNKLKYSRLLISSLQKFVKETKNIVFHPEDELESFESIGFDKLENIKFILDDYLQNGLATTNAVRTAKNSGKINWKKTLNNSLVLIDAVGRPIYLDLYGLENRVLNYEITKIHVGVLIQVFEEYAPLISNFKNIPFDINQVASSRLPINTQLKLLKNELKNQYSDRYIQLFKRLIIYLENSNNNQLSSFIIGVTKFHFAWEYMLSKCFRNIANMNKLLPKPTYISNSTKLPVTKSSMRMDMVIHDKLEKHIKILDAKYYQATSIGSLPGCTDLVKQFFYELALKTVPSLSGHSFENILIFPGDYNTFDLVEMHDNDSKKVTEFAPIRCIYKSPLDILEIYLKGIKQDL